ncbi:STAS domain-containing protein [Nocardia sp. NPDC004068]|uniref:STAS domain-containing protein n=1 Tax=Nocardia sp. NPDC004068 TaxID=3364303 RepID=UPI0036BDF010
MRRTVPVAGNLDYENADAFVAEVERLLAERPETTRLHLDCTELTFCDSTGLSALLLIRRLTEAAGIELYLDNRPPVLDRMLGLTGTFDHLVAAAGTPESAGGGRDESLNSPPLSTYSRQGALRQGPGGAAE